MDGTRSAPGEDEDSGLTAVPTGGEQASGLAASRSIKPSVLPRRTWHSDLQRLEVRFAQHAQTDPDRLALVSEEGSLSYGQLNQRAEAIAASLKDCGVGPGSLVALRLPRSFNQIAAIIGVLKAGAAYVPVSMECPQERMDQIFAQAKPTALILPGPTSSDPGVRVVATGLGRDLRRSRLANVTVDDTAHVLFTSGTTGTPKGVRISHRNVARLFECVSDHFTITAQDRWSILHSYTFDLQVWELWGALLHGGAAALLPERATQSCSEVLDQLQRYAVTIVTQTPSAFVALVGTGAGGADPRWSGVRLVSLGGEPLNFCSIRDWLCRAGNNGPIVVNSYGITETTVHSTWRVVTAQDVGEARNLCGKPFADTAIYLVDDHLVPVPQGAIGEVCVGGAGVSQGYLGGGAAEREAFLPDLLEPDRIMYRSGDIGRMTEDGECEILGRRDHQVKVRGYRVELGEVEAALEAVDGVVRAIAVKTDQDNLAAVVELQTDVRLLPTEVLAAAGTRLMPYSVPYTCVIVDQLPTTTNGKKDRREASRLVAEMRRQDRDLPLAGQTEVRLARIWSELLDLGSISAADSFAGLGGHSLAAMLALQRISDEFGVMLDLADLADSGSLRIAAARIDSLCAGGASGE